MDIFLLQWSRNGGSRLLSSWAILGAYALRRCRSLGLGRHVDTITEKHWIEDLVAVSFSKIRDTVYSMYYNSKRFPVTDSDDRRSFKLVLPQPMSNEGQPDGSGGQAGFGEGHTSLVDGQLFDHRFQK